MPRVASCGLTTLDLVQYVEHLPGPDEKVQAREARVEFGGPAANAAFTARALGLGSRLITGLGSGPLGLALRDQITAAGVEVVDVLTGREWQPPVSAVAITEHGRAVISMNAVRSSAAAVPEGALDGCGALLVDGHHLALCIDAATVARLAGIPVLLDGGSWKPGLERLIPLVDAAVLSADFAPPEPVDWGSRPVAVTHGHHDIHFRQGAEQGTVEVRPVAAGQTLGAGDVFHGAWLAHVGRFGLDDFAGGLRFATRIATLSCRFPGAHDWAEHL